MPTIFQRPHFIWCGLFAVLSAYLLITLLPWQGEIWIQFDSKGLATNSIPPLHYTSLLLMAALVPPSFIFFVLKRFPRVAQVLFNVKNLEYWDSPKNERQLINLLSNASWWIAIIFCVFAIGVHWVILNANSIEPAYLPFRYVVFLVALFFMSLGSWVRVLSQKIA